MILAGRMFVMPKPFPAEFRRAERERT